MMILSYSTLHQLRGQINHRSLVLSVSLPVYA
jgi:hypothetical protein